MLHPSIGYEIFCALFLCVLAAVFIYFVYKDNKRAKERHDRYLEALKTISHELPLIRIYLFDFVIKYLKVNEYNQN